VCIVAGHALVGHGVEDINTVEAPLNSTLAVDVLAARNEAYQSLTSWAFLEAVLLCVLSHFFVSLAFSPSLSTLLK